MLADGAKWIWEEQRKHLTCAEGVLDIFHALEHVSAVSQALHTEPTDAAEWTDAAREALLQDGWRGIQAHLRVGEASLTPCQQAAVAELRNYLGPHEHHLNDRQRLAAGRRIGSGQVEGACKNLIVAD